MHLLCRRQKPWGYNKIIILMIISYLRTIIFYAYEMEYRWPKWKKQKCLLNAFCIIIYTAQRTACPQDGNKTGSRLIHTVESVYILIYYYVHACLIIRILLLLIFEEWKWQAERKKKIKPTRYRLQYTCKWYERII